MIRENLLLTILFISLFFELTIIPLPIVFLVSIIFYVLYPSIRTIIFVMIAGLLLDILSVSVPGLTPLAALVSFLIIDLYKKAFEIRDWRVFLLILFISTYGYARIFSYSNNLLLFILAFGTAGVIIKYFTRGKTVWLK